ncbi:hypothetical protein AB6N23_05425 [Cellulomonas sp. 179-A 9B4 NHS]|uniref:hypothetical protein n=1 Tax=Cellulomonas sp. 179-A 9B4 NHS TaxID=3142379 RepID=UPI0039A27E92
MQQPSARRDDAPALVRVVPTEESSIVLELDGGVVLVLDCLDPRLERDHPGPDWSELGYPEKRKHLTFDAGAVRWPGGKVLTTGDLVARSRPASVRELESLHLRVAYRNQAPTPQDARHHVYSVYVRPFAAQPFVLGESIGGGHGERGGQATFTLAELRAWAGWEEHCALAGCGWVVPVLSTEGADERACVDALVREVCRRADTAESDVWTYAAGRSRQ